MREIGSSDVALGHSPLEATGKRFGEEKALFNYVDRSWIQDIGNTWH